MQLYNFIIPSPGFNCRPNEFLHHTIYTIVYSEFISADCELKLHVKHLIFISKLGTVLIQIPLRIRHFNTTFFNSWFQIN